MISERSSWMKKKFGEIMACVHKVSQDYKWTHLHQDIFKKIVTNIRNLRLSSREIVGVRMKNKSKK
jgi:hypothetical protein